MSSIVGSTISSTIFSRNSTVLGLNERTAFLMDNLFSIFFGLSLRFIVTLVTTPDSSLNPDPPSKYISSVKLIGSLVGLWEGIVLLHFTQKYPRSYDPYVAYAVRMFVDLLVTEDMQRMMLVLLWTGLGMVLADVGPGLWRDVGGRRAWRRVESRARKEMRGLGRVWRRAGRGVERGLRRGLGLGRVRMPRLGLGLGIPWLGDRRRTSTVRFVPSSRSRSRAEEEEEDVVSPTSPTESFLSGSGPTYTASAVSTGVTAPTATATGTTATRRVHVPLAPSISSTTSTSSTTASSITPTSLAGPIPGPTVSIHPPTPGTTPTTTPGKTFERSKPEKTRVPGHFNRESETETELTTTRNRRGRLPPPYTTTTRSGSGSGSGSISGLTTDTEHLGTSQRSKYAFFPSIATSSKSKSKSTKADLRLTESSSSSSDDSSDESSADTETPTPDAGTLRDISMEVVDAAEAAEAGQRTPRQTHPALPDMSTREHELLLTDLADPSAPKTPLPPVDQVPDIPDGEAEAEADEGWEKVERDERDAVDNDNNEGKELKRSDSKKSEDKDKGKGKGRAGSIPPESADPESLAPPIVNPTTDPIYPIYPIEPTPPPPSLPPKPRPDITKALSSTYYDFPDPSPSSSSSPFASAPGTTEGKREKAASEPGWLDAFLGKKNSKKDKDKREKLTKANPKAKSAMSAAVSSVAGVTDAFVHPQPPGTSLGGSGSATAIAREEVQRRDQVNPWNGRNMNRISDPSFWEGDTTTHPPEGQEHGDRSPPPTFSAIYPDGPPVIPGESGDGDGDDLGYQGMGDEKKDGPKDKESVKPTSRAPSTKARSTVSVSPSVPPPDEPDPWASSTTPANAPSRAASRAASVKARSTLSVSPSIPPPPPHDDDHAEPSSTTPGANVHVQSRAPSRAPSAKARSTISVSPSIPGPPNQNEDENENENEENEENEMDPWASTTSNNANKAHSRAPSKAPSAKARSTFSVSPSTPPPNDPEPSSTLAKAHSRAPSLAPSLAPSRAPSRAASVKARSTLSVSHTPPNEPEPTRELEVGTGSGSGQSPEGQSTLEPGSMQEPTGEANADADANANANAPEDEKDEKGKGDKGDKGEEPELGQEPEPKLEQEQEPDTDTELLPKDASPSEKLSVSLDLLREIEGLRGIMDGGDADAQIAKKIRKLERRVERVSCKNPSWSTSPSKAYRYEMITNQNQGISDIKQRLWEILTFTPSTPNHPGAAAPASDYLDITFPKAWKGPKAKSVRGAVIEALEGHGLETEEDPNNGRVLRVPIPFRGED